MKLPVWFFAAFFTFSGTLCAQNGAESAYTEAVRWPDASRAVFAAAGNSRYSLQDAAFYVVLYKMMPSGKEITGNADLAGIALLIMRAFEIRGGIFYTLFKNRRYAFREMLYRGVFDIDDDPRDSVSASRLELILARAKALSGGFR
ncbi:MAG: hypothetical protein LBC77_07285 [Spirochaetaceae bacterium]|nr:hypothetical protein [Spirochaetaceae bacterium]